MAKYNLFLYGTEKYGEILNVGAFYNADLTVWSYDYGRVVIKWKAVTGDPQDRTITHWKLIKSYSGIPDRPDDGIILDGGTFNNFKSSYYDVDINYGFEVHYSLWVFNGRDWILCGAGYDTLVGDTDTLTKIEKWLPSAWLNEYDGYGDATGEPETGFLNSILSAFAFQYDKFRAEAGLIENVSQSRYIPTKILTQQIIDFGFTYEPSLGDLYHRSLYKGALRSLGEKGTGVQIQSLTTALTHWDTVIKPGINRMLDYNDASFEENVGHWTVTGGTFVSKQYSTSSTDVGTQQTAPVPNFVDIDYPPRTKGYGLLTVTEASAVLTLPTYPNDQAPATKLNALKYGIPVEKYEYMLFSGWIKHLDSPATIAVTTSFYDKTGTHLGNDSTSDVHTTTTSWTEFTSGGVSRRGAEVPIGASYVLFTLTVIPQSTNDRILFDMCQVTEGEAISLEYQDPRRSTIVIEGEQNNNVPNPTFEDGIAGWVAYNAILEQDHNPIQGILRKDIEVDTYGYGESGSTQLLLNNQYSGYAPINYIDISGFTTVYINGTAHTIDSFDLQNSNQSAILTLTSPLSTKVDGVVSFYSYFNTTALKVTAAANGDFGVITEWVAADASKTYTFQVDVASAQNISAKVRLEYSSPQNDTDQNQLQLDVNGVPYYLNANQLIDSDPVALTSTASPISVTLLSPEKTVDSPQPLAKASIYIVGATAGDTFYINNAILTNTPKATYEDPAVIETFSGSGSPMLMDPVHEHYFNPDECVWETRNRFNYINNPSFITNTNDWSTTGCTLTRSNEQAKFGTHSGKVVKTGATAFLNTTVYAPYAALDEGSQSEDYVCSAYIYGAAGDYTLKATSGDHVDTATISIDANNANTWTRMSLQRIPWAGETTFTLSISSTVSTFYVDGVQVEFGKFTSKFINPQDATTFTVPSLGSQGKFYYATREPSVHGGVSNNWNNLSLKQFRLGENVKDHMPLGSSWAFNRGNAASLDVYTEYGINNLIKSPSFEKSLVGWTPNNAAKLYRTVSKGSLFNDLCSHGQAYCVVQGTGTFGLTSSLGELYTNRGVVGSVVLKAPDATGYGTYTLTVKFYTITQTLVLTKTETIHITQPNIWYYLRVITRQPEVYGLQTSYADMTVSFTPDTPSTPNTFYIDRTLLEQ
jgi:hypothetical protein